MKVSLCLIVKNEEAHLGNCLSAFKGLYDELVVVDTGSTDKTKEIAAEYGATIYDFEWINDFAAARNFALSKGTGDWLMMVDADDVMDAEDVKALRKYLEENQDKISVISIPYVAHMTNGNPGNTATLPKLWKKELNLKYESPIHEYLNIQSVSPDQIGKPGMLLIHNKSLDEFMKGFSRNVKILEEVIQKDPKNLRFLYYLVHDNRQCGNFKEATKWAEEYLKADPKDPVKLAKLLTHKGYCHLKLKEAMEAQEAFLKAIEVSPNLVGPYLALGDMHYRLGRYDDAIKMYEMAKDLKAPEGPVFHNQAAYDYFAIRKLCYILPMVDRNEEALKYAEETLKFTPTDQKLIDHIKKLKETL